MDEVYFGFFGVLSLGAMAKSEGLLSSHLGANLGFTVTVCDQETDKLFRPQTPNL